MKQILNLRGELTIAKEHQPANLFELSSEDIQVTYSSSSIKGSPLLSYRDSNNCQFSEEEIRSVKTEIGELLTVDSRTVTFTLILPVVTMLPASPGIHIEVPGITTTPHMTIAGVSFSAHPQSLPASKVHNAF